MNIIYDISPIGADPARRAGLARVAESMAERLYREFGPSLSFSATGSIWATLQAEKVIRQRDGWRSALGQVGTLTRTIHRVQRYFAEQVSESNDRQQWFYRAGDFFLKQASRALNLVRTPVDEKRLRKADVFHSSYARIPRRVRRQLPGKHILTVHDLTPLVLGAEFFSSEQIAITRRIIDSVQPEDWVIAVSESTKEDLCKRRPIDPERVFVVPNAASDDLFYPVSDTDRIADVRERYGVPKGRYLLSLHSMAPHKNVSRLIKAFHQFVQQQKVSDTYLVLAGGLGRPLEKICEDLSIARSDLDRVHFTGFVEDEDLAPLYSGAEAFVFPSLYEGFGLPVLEAMQCGCPVIVSEVASLPEIVGEAGLLIDPRSIEELSQAMTKICRSSSVLSKVSKKQRRRAECFTWKNSVKQTIKVYEQIA